MLLSSFIVWTLSPCIFSVKLKKNAWIYLKRVSTVDDEEELIDNKFTRQTSGNKAYKWINNKLTYQQGFRRNEDYYSM